MTRALIDQKIAEITSALNEAVQKKAFQECDSLQAELDKWTKKREEVPTVDELRQKVKEYEDQVALAAKNKDFVGAAEAQSRLDEYRARVAQAMAEEAGDESSSGEPENLFGFESRAQLEMAIKDMANQIKKAIASKDFSKASSLQQTLEEREGLRKYFPTIEELQGQLKKAQKSLESALSKKDFEKAGMVDKTISSLQSKIAAEKEKLKELDPDESDSNSLSMVTLDGDERKFKSRGELEAAITEVTKKVSEAVKNNDFKQADDLQKTVDKMTKMRQFLPSIVELERKLKQLKGDLNKAISAKQFARADELHLGIENLEAKIAKEKELLPAPKDVQTVKTAPLAASVTPAKATSVASVQSAYSTPAKRIVPSTRPVAVQASGASSSKTVKTLRPAKPVSLPSSISVVEVTKEMVARRVNASILTHADGRMAGILTDKDVVRRVVAKGVDPFVAAEDVMTRDPMYVGMDSSAADALTTMVANRFRHLPVVDDTGGVVGLLDIAKCLSEAIDRLERSVDHNKTVADKAVQNIMNQAGGAQAEAMKSLLEGLVSQAFGSQMPILGSLVKDGKGTIVSPDTSVADAAYVMAEYQKAALVVENNVLIGVFGFKDLVTRVLAKDLDLLTTSVKSVMTPSPEFLSPDSTVLEAVSAP